MRRSPVPLWVTIVTIMVVILVADRITNSVIVELLIAVAAGLLVLAIRVAISYFVERRQARRVR